MMQLYLRVHELIATQLFTQYEAVLMRYAMIVLSVLPMIPVCILLSKYIIKAGPIIDGAITG